MSRDLQHLSLREIRDRYFSDAVEIPGSILRRLSRDPRQGARRLRAALAKRAQARKLEKARLDAMLHFERVLWRAGIGRIAGVDEVGIGPLAGPVVAAAVVFLPGSEIAGINDSKLLDPATRERLDREIRLKALGVGIGIVEPGEIDRLNIYHAGIRAMQLALGDLPSEPQHILVDARTIPDIAAPQNCFNKGDGINFSIAAASIVAKVFRDRRMSELDLAYPGYGFARHKGYGTEEHRRAIREMGPCPIHRRSFEVIHEIRGEYGDRFYDLRRQAGAIRSPAALREWESRIGGREAGLSPNEIRKLRIIASRLWKKMD